MSDDKQLYDLFKSNKKEFLDNGFSKQVTRHLPERNSLLPRIIICVCLLLGLLLTGWLQGGVLLYEGIQNLVISLSYTQFPPVSGIIDYLIFLSLVSSISVSTLYFYEK